MPERTLELIMGDLKETERSRLRRSHNRGVFDRDAVNEILDATSLCHVGYNIDGKPLVTPTFHWREGNHIYWHGSSASRMLRNANKSDVCLTVTHLDGFVIARSGFHHSVNFRSVMLVGQPEIVSDPEIATERLKIFVDGIFPGRWDTLRPMNEKELKATTVLSMEIDEGSAKVRTGPPVDDEEDYALPIWAGVVPVTQIIGDPIPCERLDSSVAVPEDVLKMKFG